MQKELSEMFLERLQSEMEKRDQIPADLSKSAQIPYPTIRGWLKKGRLPDCKSLSALADYYGVSTDYLLGRIDQKKHDLEALYGALGLSEDAIISLQRFKQTDRMLGIELTPGRLKCKALSRALASRAFLEVVSLIMMLETGKRGYYEGTVHSRGSDFYTAELSPDSFAAVLYHRLQLTLQQLRTGESPEEYAPAAERGEAETKRLMETGEADPLVRWEAEKRRLKEKCMEDIASIDRMIKAETKEREKNDKKARQQ